MSPLAFSALAIFTLLCMLAAQRLARSKGKSPVIWMLAATAFGPLPLIPLAFLRDRALPQP